MVGVVWPTCVFIITGGGEGGGVAELSGGVPHSSSGRFDRELNNVRTPALVYLCPRCLLDQLMS